MACNAFGSGRLIVGLLLCLYWLGNAHVHAMVFTPGPLIVGMKPTELQTERVTTSSSRPNEAALSDVLARTVQDLLPGYIVRSLERGLDRRVVVLQKFNADSFTGPNGEPLGAIIEPRVVSISGLGVKMSAKITTRVGKSVLEGDEVLLLSPTTNYGELEEKMTDFGLRTAKRLAAMNTPDVSSANPALPRGVVRFYCVQPIDSANRTLQQLGRRLTLELPYFLTEASQKKGLDVAVRGLEFKEMLAVCQQQRAPEKPIEQKVEQKVDEKVETYSWDATIAADAANPKVAQLSVRASDPFSRGNYRRIARIAIVDVANPDLPDIANRVVEGFLKQTTSR